MAVTAKEEKKRRSTVKAMEALDLCKEHGGPLTPKDLHKLDVMDEAQVLAEAKYLKKTTAPNIRLKHKEGVHSILHR